MCSWAAACTIKLTNMLSITRATMCWFHAKGCTAVTQAVRCQLFMMSVLPFTGQALPSTVKENLKPFEKQIPHQFNHMHVLQQSTFQSGLMSQQGASKEQAAQTSISPQYACPYSLRHSADSCCIADERGGQTWRGTQRCRCLWHLDVGSD